MEKCFKQKLYDSEGDIRRYDWFTLGSVVKIRSRSQRFF